MPIKYWRTCGPQTVTVRWSKCYAGYEAVCACRWHRGWFATVAEAERAASKHLDESSVLPTRRFGD